MLWSHYPNTNIFSDHQNRLYAKAPSLRCGSKLIHSPGPAAAKALSPKVLLVRVTTHVRLSVEHSRCSRRRWWALPSFIINLTSFYTQKASVCQWRNVLQNQADNSCYFFFFWYSAVVAGQWLPSQTSVFSSFLCCFVSLAYVAHQL